MDRLNTDKPFHKEEEQQENKIINSLYRYIDAEIDKGYPGDIDFSETKEMLKRSIKKLTTRFNSFEEVQAYIMKAGPGNELRGFATGFKLAVSMMVNVISNNTERGV